MRYHYVENFLFHKWFIDFNKWYLWLCRLTNVISDLKNFILEKCSDSDFCDCKRCFLISMMILIWVLLRLLWVLVVILGVFLYDISSSLLVKSLPVFIIIVPALLISPNNPNFSHNDSRLSDLKPCSSQINEFLCDYWFIEIFSCIISLDHMNRIFFLDV